jgi:hypothetical protein
MEELYDLHPDPVDPNTRIKKKKEMEIEPKLDESEENVDTDD